MIVLDASVVIDFLLRSGAWKAIENRIEREHLHAPELLDLEVLQVLRRYALHEGLSLERADQAISDLEGLRLERHRHDLLVPGIWALHRNLTAYDAAYVALAELLDAPLLTRDGQLAGSAGHGATIELIEP